MRKIYTLIVMSLFTVQAFSQQSIPEYCLENDVVHRYLTEVQYDPNDYSYSLIRNYCYDYPWNWKEEGGVRLDIPKPVSLKFTKELDKARTLYVSETEDFADAWTYSVGQNIDTIDVYNLIPGRTYLWKAEYDDNGVITVAESGVFKTTGTLRMLKIDNIFNVRDMGGWIGLGGHPMKYGKIIRGSRLNVNNSSTKIITEDGIKELRKVGIKAELDMRNRSNAANASYSFLGSDIPIYNVENAYNSRIATFANAPQSIQGIKKLIEWLKAGKPVYLHCSVGADRTGTVAYLVGALCGMSEDALSKEFELTSFSGDKIENERDRPNPERLIRQRDYTGRLDPNDNNESYKFAKMVDKIKTYPGNTLQEKVYYHLKTGVNGESIPEKDLDWLIKELVDYVMVKSITTDGGATLSLEPGQEQALNAVVVPENATENTLTYTSLNPEIAVVSDSGVITAVRGGSATIEVKAGEFVKTITVNVPKVESVVPDSVVYGGMVYKVTGTNLISNGSFEYGGYFTNWINALNTSMSSSEFDVVMYGNGDSCYIQSKYDGGEQSVKSIRTQWKIKKSKTYVFGYRVKNSTDLKTVENKYLATSLTYYRQKVSAGADDFVWGVPQEPELVFKYPSYDGNWTEIQYVFTNTEGYEYCQVLFSHLSQNGNNTCFDNFYLVEVEAVDTSVKRITDNSSKGIYDLYGRRLSQPSNGIILIDGKKYLNR